jgi:hypothetical protein
MFKGFLFFWISWYAIRYAIFVWLGLIGIGIVWTVVGCLSAVFAFTSILQKLDSLVLVIAGMHLNLAA